jgi:hypothetical protein
VAQGLLLLGCATESRRLAWAGSDTADFGWLKARHHFKATPEGNLNHRSMGSLVVRRRAGDEHVIERKSAVHLSHVLIRQAVVQVAGVDLSSAKLASPSVAAAD